MVLARLLTRFPPTKTLGLLAFHRPNLATAHDNPKRNFQFYSAMPQQQPIILNSKDTEKPQAIVVFLHGLGDTGDGWSYGFKDPSIRDDRVKYVFPTAATIPVSLNGGFPMTAWFDIYGLSPTSKEDTAGIEKAATEMRQLIEKELISYPHLTEKNVILGGFSLGGAAALYTALSHQSSYGGLIGLSTWLPMRNTFLEDKILFSRQKVNELQIFQGHGDADPVVPFQFGQLTSQIIGQAGLDSKFKSYAGMAHSSCEEEMRDMKKFIEKFLK